MIGEEILTIPPAEHHHLIIWGHGLEVREQILSVIEGTPGFDIQTVRQTNHRSATDLIAKAYAHDTSQIKHLTSKTLYLRQFEPKAFHVVVSKSRGPIKLEKFTGGWVPVDEAIRDLKWSIRARFNPKNRDQSSGHDHVIHAADSHSQSVQTWQMFFGRTAVIADAGGVKSTFGLWIPNHLKVGGTVCFQEVSPLELMASLNTNSGVIQVPVQETPHYQMLSTNTSSGYQSYIETFRGKELTDWYSVEKFKTLSQSLSSGVGNPILVRDTSVTQRKFVILDGLHRAAIALHLERDFVEVGIFGGKDSNSE